jgi:hypothetical protein
VVAPDYQPKFVTKVDPATGPVRVSLVAKSFEGLGPKQKLAGRVTDQTGKPVEGAKIEFEWVETNDGQGCGGVCDEWGVEPLAVSDSNGDFVLTARKPFDRMTVAVEARAFAKGKFMKLTSGELHHLRLGEGATVAGRIMHDGRAVPGTSAGLVSVDRSPEGGVGDFEIGTDEDGRFAFPTIPPGRQYFIYTMMRDAKASGGVVPVRKIVAGKDRETTKVGDLIMEPTCRIAGRLVMAQGAALPPGARIMLGREDAWDTLPNVDVPSDGHFVFEGVPKERVNVSPRVKGYKLSLLNPSLDRLNGFSVVGTVAGNVDDLIILLDPGEFHPDYNNPGPDPQPYDKPLRAYHAPVSPPIR